MFSGSSGEEVFLSERRLQEDDIEHPAPAQPEHPHSSQQLCPAGGLSHSDSSDIEQEQDFVSSVFSQRQGPRVHWGDLPKRTDEDEKGKLQRRKKDNSRVDEEEMEENQSRDLEKLSYGERKELNVCETKVKAEAEQLHVVNTDLTQQEERESPEEPAVEEAAAKMSLCTLSETVTSSVHLLPADSTPAHTEHTTDSEPPEAPAADLNSQRRTGCDQPGLNITQVGMSKKGAAGLRDLLKNHTAAPKPNTIHLNLLECLRETLRDWSTDETLKFLYGADHSLGSPFPDLREEGGGDKDEELDEDDLEDDVTAGGEGGDAGVRKRPTAAVPDFDMLKKETQQQELRVREFYKGTWILPEEVQAPNVNKVSEGGREWRKKKTESRAIDSCCKRP